MLSSESESEAKLCRNFCHQLTSCNNCQESILLDIHPAFEGRWYIQLLRMICQDDDGFYWIYKTYAGLPNTKNIQSHKSLWKPFLGIQLFFWLLRLILICCSVIRKFIIWYIQSLFNFSYFKAPPYCWRQKEAAYSWTSFEKFWISMGRFDSVDRTREAHLMNLYTNS